VNELAARVFGSWVRRVDRTVVRADVVAGLLGALLVSLVVITYLPSLVLWLPKMFF